MDCPICERRLADQEIPQAGAASANRCRPHGVFVRWPEGRTPFEIDASSSKEKSWKPCPGCERKLTEVSTAGVRLDHCASCGGIWFDRGELETLGGDARADSDRKPRVRDVGIAEILADLF